MFELYFQRLGAGDDSARCFSVRTHSGILWEMLQCALCEMLQCALCEMLQCAHSLTSHYLNLCPLSQRLLSLPQTHTSRYTLLHMHCACALCKFQQIG